MGVLPIAMLGSGSEILLDANILVYALSDRSRQCQELLHRCAIRDISGFTTVDVLSDVCHRLMIAEAAGLGLIHKANASSLKGKSSVVRQLGSYWSRLTKAMSGNLAILPLDEFRFVRAHHLRKQHGLMTNDSIVLAAADVFGIELLASNDSDFDAIEWLTIYRPTDIP